MSIKLTNALNASGLEPREKAALMAGTLAISLAYSLPVPTVASAVNPYAYFDENHENEVKEIILEFNERCLLSVKQCIELTKRIWVQRFNLVHDPLTLNPFSLIRTLNEIDDIKLGEDLCLYSTAMSKCNSSITSAMDSVLLEVKECIAKCSAK